MRSTVSKALSILGVNLTLIFMISCTETESMDVTPGTGTSNPTTNNMEEPANAPAFTLKSISGADVSLSDFENKVVVLFFFGNTCPTCKAVAPSIEKDINQAFKDSPNFQLLGLDQWDGNKASVESFKSSTKVTFPLLQKASGVASDYKTTYDRLVVINRGGKIVFLGKQNSASDLRTVVSEIEKLL
ncbi:peroxiredoxin family protein [Jiulongibacter sp. NS-SX5]|uniref:peroxiredoxin family protein n=1 Tax=Jiulongibacter sp. NS-SX5 TaxID=3463854 RepID=UPI00405A322E